MALTSATDRPPVSPLASRVTGEIDRLSLAQALVDVEVANARVVDLTARLVVAERRLRQVTDERDALRRVAEQPIVPTPVFLAAAEVSVTPAGPASAHRAATATRAAAITARRALRVARRVRAALRHSARP